MSRIYGQNFSYNAPDEPSAELFDRIILSIKKEKEVRRARKVFFFCILLSALSAVSVVFSWRLLANQAVSSGIIYFISAAAGNIGVFLESWKDFVFVIFESLPLAGVLAFSLSVSLALFTLRFFLRKKWMFWHYIPSIFYFKTN